MLAIEVIQDHQAQTISLSHHSYIDKIVAQYGQSDAKNVYSPMSTCLTKAHSPSTPEKIAEMCSKPYQAAVGSLNHAAVMTCSDIAKAVQTVAQFSSNPGKCHWDTIIHIIRYLKTM